MKSVLIFPSSLESAISHLNEAKKWNFKTIGASSLENDPYKDQYDEWVRLPYIHEDGFKEKLSELIASHDVHAISTPHAPSYQMLFTLKDHFPGITILGESPNTIQMNRIKNAQQLETNAIQSIRKLTAVESTYKPGFLAAMLAHAIPLYGESSFEKIAAMCAVFLNAPKGDVVEIGSFFGKSAYVLGKLANETNTGPVLAVDPWNMGLSIQRESPENIQALSGAWDWNLVFKGFLLTIQGGASTGINYLRMPSAEAFSVYSQSNSIETLEFGRTQYTGKIAVLHIDGNHDEEAVQIDFDLWTSKLSPGGWIIFDDYEWSQADGPRKVADKILKERKNDIEKFFVAGSAAYIKMGKH